jgi:ABC-type cobalamin/Fe3+-siderophores transport system ATPase subunit
MQVGMKTTTQSAVTAAVIIVEQTLSPGRCESVSAKRRQREARRDVSKCALEKHRVEDLAEREREERERSKREAVL